MMYNELRKDPALTMAMTAARIHHAVMSSAAAQVMTSAPSRVFVDPAFLHDARQNRECRNAHGDAQKQTERQEIDAFRCKSRIDKISQPNAQRERKNDAHVADDDGVLRFGLQRFQIQLHAHDKHKQNQPDLAQKLKVGIILMS